MNLLSGTGLPGALTLLMLLVGGCQNGGLGQSESGAERTDRAAEISVAYDRLGGAGYIDQALTIRNGSGSPVLLKAKIEPLDASGGVLPAVDVSGVYGAADGGQVLLEGENVDFLTFNGSGAAQVRDVRLTDMQVKPVGFPSARELVEAVPLDEAGRELNYPAGFSSVELRNPNPAEVTVRVVSIVWDQPAEGQSQQALEVVPLSRVISVPADGATTIEVTPADRQRILSYASSNALSLKAYFSV